MDTKPFSYRSCSLAIRSELPYESVESDYIPPEARAAKRWICTKSAYRKNPRQWTRLTVAPNGREIDFREPAHWLTFDDAIDQQEQHNCNGIGFVLGDDGDGRNFAGLNLDDCINPRKSQLSPYAQSVLALFQTYAEVSPTGTGIKAFLLGRLWEEDVNRYLPENVRLYDRDRYFAFTGVHVPGTPLAIANREQELNAYWAAYASGKIHSTIEALEGRTIQAFDAEVVVRSTRLHNKNYQDDINGEAQLFTIACNALQSGLEDHQIVDILRHYTESHYFPCIYSDHDLLRFIFKADTSVYDPMGPISGDVEPLLGLTTA